MSVASKAASAAGGSHPSPLKGVTKPRMTCPACGRDVSQRKDGTPTAHQPFLSDGYTRQMRRCPGAKSPEPTPLPRLGGPFAGPFG